MDPKLTDIIKEVQEEDQEIYDKAFKLYMKDEIRQLKGLVDSSKRRYEEKLAKYQGLTVLYLEQEFETGKRIDSIGTIKIKEYYINVVKKGPVA